MPPVRAAITHIAGANMDASYVVYSDDNFFVRKMIICSYKSS